MNLSENFESVKNFAMGAAQTATQKAKVLAAVAKANVSIYAEEDKIRKAEAQLGKLYYRDYAVSEEMDSAEYLPWCQKIDESKQLIEQLRAYISELKEPEETVVATADESDFVKPEATAEAPATEKAPAEEAPAEAPVEDAPAANKAPAADNSIVIDITRHDAE